MSLPGDGFFRSDYSVGEKLLHHMALSLPWVRKASFDVDGLFTKDIEWPANRKHVFICGLARAGTTILMRAFYQTGQFRSLTYRDMPFVLMPLVWHQLTKASQKKGVLRQRTHGDGITIDYDSPEAFEEVFWHTYAGRDYIHNDKLVPHIASKDLIERFRIYVNRILQGANETGKSRYLSKNNNNILRLSSIQGAFPQALIIIPFRDPIQQSNSLFEQHQRFCDIHRNDKFSCQYMRWLGHHEFGLTHRPFEFDDSENAVTLTDRPGSINYWLSLWNSTYRYLLKMAPANSVFSCHEELCEHPDTNLNYLFELAQVPREGGMSNLERRTLAKRHMPLVDEALWRDGQMIYDELKVRGRKH